MNIEKTNEQKLIEWSNKARETVESRLEANCQKVGVSVSDVVGAALSYVTLRALNEPGKYMPGSYGTFAGYVRNKAECLVRDGLRKMGREHGVRSVHAHVSGDEPSADQDGQTNDRSLFDEYALSSWRWAEEEEERRFRCRLVRKVLDAVIARSGMGELNRGIYREVVLDEQPREEVARRYGTTRNNVDQIVARVKRCLLRDGRALYDAFYAVAA